MPISDLMPQRLGNFLGIIEKQTVTRGANGYRQCFYGSDRSRCDGVTFDTDLFFQWFSAARGSSFSRHGRATSSQECSRRYAQDGGHGFDSDVPTYVDRAVELYGPFQIEVISDAGADCRLRWTDLETGQQPFDSESASVVLDTGVRLIYQWLDRSVEVTTTTGIYEIVELAKTGLLVAFGVGVVVAGFTVGMAILRYFAPGAAQRRAAERESQALQTEGRARRARLRKERLERDGFLERQERRYDRLFGEGAFKAEGFKKRYREGTGVFGGKHRYFAPRKGGPIEKRVIDGKRYFKGRDGKWRLSRF